jgi:hypothetical protein
MEDEAAANQELAIDETGADSMEADLVEAVDLGADIDEGTGEMEQTVQDADQLERHVEVLEDAEGEGGASAEVVEATEIAVEAICNRLGIYKTGIPALESFSTKSGRARNTRIAIEGIKDTIKRIWEAVKAAFRKMVDYVKNFFKKIFDVNERMLARINKLREKARNVEGTKGDKINGGGIGSVIPADKLTDPKGAIMHDGSFANVTDRANKLVASAKAAMQAVTNEAKYNSFSGELNDFKHLNGGSFKNAPDGMEWKGVATVGTTYYAILLPTAKGNGEAWFSKAGQIKVEGQTQQGLKDKPEIKPADASDVVKICNVLESVVEDFLKKEKSNLESLQENIDSLTDAVDTVVDALSSENSDAEGNKGGAERRAADVRKAVTSLSNAAVSVITKVGMQTTRVCQAYLAYGERSIGSYSTSNKNTNKTTNKNTF